MAADNPFAPTFGASPPILAGRDDILDHIDDALATGPTHPDYTTLLIGIRGAGKTVMLNAVEDLARRRGWLAVSDNASPPGLLLRLTRSTSSTADRVRRCRARAADQGCDRGRVRRGISDQRGDRGRPRPAGGADGAR